MVRPLGLEVLYPAAVVAFRMLGSQGYGGFPESGCLPLGFGGGLDVHDLQNPLWFRSRLRPDLRGFGAYRGVYLGALTTGWRVGLPPFIPPPFGN